jgi:hypothetical protein
MDDRQKTFRAWDPNKGRQQAYVPQDVLPEDDLVFFVMDVIPQMDSLRSMSTTSANCGALPRTTSR